MNELKNAIEQAVEGEPISVLEFARGQGHGTALVYPGYFPLELLDACGLWPVTPWHYFDTAPADAHLPPFACTFSKAFLSLAIEHEGAFDVIALSNICDTAQNLFALVKKIFPEKRVLWFYLPQNPTSRAAKEHIRTQLKAVWGKISNSKDADKLKEAIGRRNEARAKLATLDDLKRRGLLTFDEWNSALFAYFCTPAKLANALLDDVLKGAKEGQESEETIKLFALGKVVMPTDTTEFLASHGATVIGDSLLLGSRSQLSKIPQTDDPLNDLADSLAHIAASPYHHTEPYDYPERTAKGVAESNARGAIVFRLKYCDPDGFDYPAIKKALDKIKVPSLLLEVEMKRNLTGTEKTRLEAFIESLKGAKPDAS